MPAPRSRSSLMTANRASASWLVRLEDRLVHKQRARLGRKRLGDFDELPVANGQGAHQGIRRHLEPELCEGRRRPPGRKKRGETEATAYAARGCR